MLANVLVIFLLLQWQKHYEGFISVYSSRKSISSCEKLKQLVTFHPIGSRESLILLLNSHYLFSTGFQPLEWSFPQLRWSFHFMSPHLDNSSKICPHLNYISPCESVKMLLSQMIVDSIKLMISVNHHSIAMLKCLKFLIHWIRFYISSCLSHIVL